MFYLFPQSRKLEETHRRLRFLPLKIIKMAPLLANERPSFFQTLLICLRFQLNLFSGCVSGSPCTTRPPKGRLHSSRWSIRGLITDNPAACRSLPALVCEETGYTSLSSSSSVAFMALQVDRGGSSLSGSCAELEKKAGHRRLSTRPGMEQKGRSTCYLPEMTPNNAGARDDSRDLP